MLSLLTHLSVVWLVVSFARHGELAHFTPEKIPNYAVVPIIVILALVVMERRTLSKKWLGILNSVLMLISVPVLFLWLPVPLVFRTTISVGGLFNTIAIIANKGFMPIEAKLCLPHSDKTHVSATNTTRMRFFIDRFGHPLLCLGACSVGDVFVYSGVIGMAVYELAMR